MPTTRRSFLRSLFFAPQGAPDRKALAAIFLRGGADGLSMVVPHFEKEYYELRPTLSIAPPGKSGGCLDLDGRFGLHPAFESLAPYWRDRRLALVHAVGSDDDTRSHFEAQDLMERAGPAGSVAGGWLARHMRTRPGEAPAALSAVALSTSVPESLRGAGAAAIASLSELRLDSSGAIEAALEGLYGGGEDAVAEAGRGTLEVLRRVRSLKVDVQAPGLLDSGFRFQLAQLAALIRADVGLEAACLDLGGWDTHFTQGTSDGLLAGRIRELSDGLAGFCKDLGPALDRTIVVVMTEFGRRVYENGSLGTDHGRGGVMMLLGAGVRGGGRVVADWPGLGEDAREGPGDLAVTIDYRHILAEVLARGAGNERMDRVFPGFTPRYQNLIA